MCWEISSWLGLSYLITYPVLHDRCSRSSRTWTLTPLAAVVSTLYRYVLLLKLRPLIIIFRLKAGFGWTNGAVLWVASNYGDLLVAPQCPSLLATSVASTPTASTTSTSGTTSPGSPSSTGSPGSNAAIGSVKSLGRARISVIIALTSLGTILM